jgi:hypothetical protein
LYAYYRLRFEEVSACRFIGPANWDDFSRSTPKPADDLRQGWSARTDDMMDPTTKDSSTTPPRRREHRVSRRVLIGGTNNDAKLETLGRWVIPTGGAFLFAPSLSLLRTLQ